ncbi:S1C family serine protease [Zavarzinella formosa]|uniref:S1C family serine protease n=1 Tax=Zavarzinella formosa TaxID=360055 RepID=UPI0002E0BF15|nr:PDZ domain-containing protein [Zavarzinella formosa]
MLKRILFSAALAILITGVSSAQRGRDRDKDTLPQKTTPQLLAAFKPAVEKPSKSTVSVQVDGKQVSLGAIVTADGSIITKASEIVDGKLTVKTREGKEFMAKVTGTNSVYDVAILKVEADNLPTVDWSPSKNAPVGNWIAASNTSTEPVGVGVVGVAARTLPPPYGPGRVIKENSGFLGIILDPDSASASIAEVSKDSAAEKAGLKTKDIILTIDNQDIVNGESLINTLLGYKAGDVIKVKLERESKKMEFSVTLGKRPAALIPKGDARGDMQNRMGSILSNRRTGFPTVLQHDIVLKPNECGGPLVDLDGRVIGLNIARAGRTETYAIPSEVILQLLPELLASKVTYTAAEEVTEAREALRRAEAAKAAADKLLVDAKSKLEKSLTLEKWWKDHPLEKGPAPRLVEKK